MLNDLESRNSKPFKWAAKSNQVALLLSLGKFTIKDIGKNVGISRVSIHTWKKHPEFINRVKELEKQNDYEIDIKRNRHEQKIIEKVELALLERLPELSNPKNISICGLLKRYYEGIANLSSNISMLDRFRKEDEQKVDLSGIIKYLNGDVENIKK